MKLIATAAALAGLVFFSTAAQACPDGQYEDGLFHVCLPYGPSNVPGVPGQLSCGYWSLHPMYFQAVFVLNHVDLSPIGVTDQNSCASRKGDIANAISQYYDFAIGKVADDLFRCACMNSNLASTSSAPPAPGRLAPRCRVNPNALPPGIAPRTYDGAGPQGSSCYCPIGGSVLPGLIWLYPDAGSPRPSFLACRVNPAALPPGTPTTSCPGSGAYGDPCGCPNFQGGAVSGAIDMFPG